MRIPNLYYLGHVQMQPMKHSESSRSEKSEILQISYPLRNRNLDSAFFIEIDFNTGTLRIIISTTDERLFFIPSILWNVNLTVCALESTKLNILKNEILKFW